VAVVAVDVRRTPTALAETVGPADVLLDCACAGACATAIAAGVVMPSAATAANEMILRVN
jgi:hypothetical protein